MTEMKSELSKIFYIRHKIHLLFEVLIILCVSNVMELDVT